MCCSVKDDIRPGLIHSRTQQREHNIRKNKTVTDEKNKQQNRPHRLLEAERREEGLNEAIGDSNKGFALLQKMGYKPGMAIGKSGDVIVHNSRNFTYTFYQTVVAPMVRGYCCLLWESGDHGTIM